MSGVQGELDVAGYLDDVAGCQLWVVLDGDAFQVWTVRALRGHDVFSKLWKKFFARNLLEFGRYQRVG
jgi:hypothetical protein